MNSRIVILAVVARPLYLVILLASLWVLLRGHNEPGGGFIGGLMAVSATILWGVAHGTTAARARLPLLPVSCQIRCRNRPFTRRLGSCPCQVEVFIARHKIIELPALHCDMRS